MLYLNHHKTNLPKEHPRMASITQDMKYRLSLIKYAERYGITKAAIKYKTHRQYIYHWKHRYDGSIDSLRELSRCPHHHPNQHTPEFVPSACLVNKAKSQKFYLYTAIGEYSRWRFAEAFEEHSSFSLMRFL